MGFTNIDSQYRIGVLRQFTQALSKVYTASTFPDQDMANKINVLTDYPIVRERYPAIYTSFVEQEIRDGGLGHYTIEIDPDTLQPTLLRHWFFQGGLFINILALDPIERDLLAASFTDIMAFGKDKVAYKPFRQYVYNEEFVSLQILTSSILVASPEVLPCPWKNNDEFIYSIRYGLPCFGSFITSPDTGELIRVSAIHEFPYNPQAGDSVPQGSQLPQDKSIPWVNE